ncbi:MAG TPA: GAF domain-containing protein [Thermoanaerobaculia bacterium]|nr:GAF domain-containing protein [Thermoanaerobaculia bacterium]
MHESAFDRAAPKPELYAALARSLESLIAGEPDPIANLANAAALVWEALPAINWAGFYLLRDGELVLGPFQGKAACVRIPVGKGVCGTAADRRESIVVEDVNRFPGHIACDAASRSEIVVPLIAAGRLVGVLDVDAPAVGRFDADDRRGLEAVAAIVAVKLSGPF